MNDTSKSTTKKHRYNLASAISRIGSRFLDLLMLMLLNIGLFFAIFANETFASLPIWKFSLACFILSFTLFIYFIVVPFFSGGYTVFSAAVKIRIYSITLRTITSRKWLKQLDFVFLVQLMYREALNVGTYIIIFLVLGIVGFIFPDQTKLYIQKIFNSIEINNQTDLNNNYVAIVFSSLFSIAAMANLLIIANVIMFNKKRSFTDHISNTVVIKMIDVIGGNDPQMPLNFKNKTRQIKYNLPGELDIDEIYKE